MTSTFDDEEIKKKVIDKVIKFTEELKESKNNPYRNDERGFAWEHALDEIKEVLVEKLKRVD